MRCVSNIQSRNPMTHYHQQYRSRCAKGAAYLVEVPLPEHSGGGRHVSVVLSSPEYHATGFALIAPLRKVRPNSYRCPIYQHEFTACPGALPLDRDRVLDLGQVTSISINSLGPRIGAIAATAMTRVDEMIPQQFQFAGPWEIRGAVWTLTDRAPLDRVVLVMNDLALENDTAIQLTTLEVTDRGIGNELIMIHADWLDAELGALQDAQQNELTEKLASMFGLAKPSQPLVVAG